MRRRYLPFFLILVTGYRAAADFPARVVGITDGDTLTVLTADHRQVKIRLHGIDAPETGQDFGSRAKQAASELAFGKEVTVRPMEKDRYGRTVAEVPLPGGRSLGREMVRQGRAWWYRTYAPGDRELARLEAEAKTARRGLWSQPGAVPPWKWRNGDGAADTTKVIGNRRSRAYHRPTCPSVGRMSARNRVEFASPPEAKEAGYRRAGDCRPLRHD
jgi:endonuclease YncB( thermonuclease family)